METPVHEKNTDTVALTIRMALAAWDSHIKRVDDLLENLSDEQLQKDTAPGRNSGVYLLGHLTAVHDGILPLFGGASRHYPGLENIFLKNPDKSGLAFPSIGELRKSWKTVNATLATHFHSMAHSDWFARHAAVSEADFAKEPHRNKLNVLINRTNHLSYHLGQLVYLKEKTQRDE